MERLPTWTEPCYKHLPFWNTGHEEVEQKACFLQKVQVSKWKRGGEGTRPGRLISWSPPDTPPALHREKRTEVEGGEGCSGTETPSSQKGQSRKSVAHSPYDSTPGKLIRVSEAEIIVSLFLPERASRRLDEMQGEKSQNHWDALLCSLLCFLSLCVSGSRFSIPMPIKSWLQKYCLGLLFTALYLKIII